MLIIWLSHVVILKNVLQMSKRKSSFWWFLVIYIGAAVYSTVFLQFTTTALWAGIAACILGIDTFQRENDGKEQIFEIFLLLFLVTISYSIRKSVGMAVLAFLGICFLINGIKQYRSKRKVRKIIMVFSGTILAVLATICITSIYEKENGWKEWRIYHEERATYKDYMAVNYAEDSDIYESIGWDQNLYDLVNKWFFMDSRVNKESFEILNKHKQAVESREKSLVKLYGCIQYVIRVLQSFPMARIMLLQMNILGLYLIYRSVVYKDRSLLFNVLIILLCAYGMLLYLGIKGRLPLRAFQVCVLPAIVLLGYLCVKEGDIIKSEFEKYVNVFITFILFMCMSGSILYTYRQTLNEDVTKGIEIRMEMENYAVNHPENIYIHDDSVSFGADPFVTYSSEKPTNYIFWGGSTMFSPVYERQLGIYERKNLYADALLEKDIYVVSRAEMDADTLLVKYMESCFENISYKKVDDVNGCGIYKFFVDN